MATPPRTDSSHRAYLDRYHADRSSIFVGALPADVGEPQLRQLFELYGPIVDIAIRITPSRYDPEESICFAFVEYRSWESVPRVMAAKVSSSNPTSVKVLIPVEHNYPQWKASPHFTERCYDPSQPCPK